MSSPATPGAGASRPANGGSGRWDAVTQPVRRTLTFIRFSHTIFAMPFALGAMLAASRGRPGWRTLGLILLSMVFARTAAMTFNRLADWHIDQRNPRTAGRHRLVSRRSAGILLAVSAMAFVGVTYFINAVCFALSPVALGIIFFYSLTKRFTHYTQVFLGLALSVAPVGAWLAVTGRFALPPLVLALGVLQWVAGFDLIYATQDYEFDKGTGLHSLVVKLGIPGQLAPRAMAPWRSVCAAFCLRLDGVARTGVLRGAGPGVGGAGLRASERGGAAARYRCGGPGVLSEQRVRRSGVRRGGLGISPVLIRSLVLPLNVTNARIYISWHHDLLI